MISLLQSLDSDLSEFGVLSTGRCLFLEEGEYSGSTRILLPVPTSLPLDWRRSEKSRSPEEFVRFKLESSAAEADLGLSVGDS